MMRCGMRGVLALLLLLSALTPPITLDAIPGMGYEKR